MCVVGCTPSVVRACVMVGFLIAAPLFERENDGIQHGWSDNYLAISAPAGSFPLGKCVNVAVNEKFLTENLQTCL